MSKQSEKIVSFAKKKNEKRKTKETKFKTLFIDHFFVLGAIL